MTIISIILGIYTDNDIPDDTSLEGKYNDLWTVFIITVIIGGFIIYKLLKSQDK